ncbi:MAG: hypothetical protein JJU45_06950 [Acidimicrobiia bacterium]|nr:hypothetical protein [Acidimicrobiia bacterium]
MSSKYEAITKRLTDATEPVVVLTFGELDRLVGGLPTSARRQSAWWANSRTSHDHARYWLDAERRATPDFNAGRVRFEFGAETVGEPQAERPRTEPPRSDAARKRSRGGADAGRHDLSAQMTSTIAFEWTAGGSVTLDDAGTPVVPELPTRPGIYRFDLTDVGGVLGGVYIGESDNLSRRVGAYRSPGKNQATVRRINGRIRDVLGDGGSAEVAVVFEATFDDEPLDLALAPARLLVGSAALIGLLRRGYPVENL